jgi:hypothetical protein
VIVGPGIPTAVEFPSMIVVDLGSDTGIEVFERVLVVPVKLVVLLTLELVVLLVEDDVLELNSVLLLLLFAKESARKPISQYLATLARWWLSANVNS